MSLSAPASSICSVTFVERTTSASGAYERIASTKASSFTSGWYENSHPAASSPSRPDCSNLSAINTRMVFNASSDRVNKDCVAQLRLEPSGLRRHYAARVGDAQEVFDRSRI